MGDIQVNRFKDGDVVNDFSSFGIRAALTANGIGYKKMYYDIEKNKRFIAGTELTVPYKRACLLSALGIVKIKEKK